MLGKLENLIVPVLNRYDLLQRMLNSVDIEVAHLLIIDNGASNKENPLELDFSDKFKKITILPMPANLGVAGSWNLGMKSFPYAERWFIVSDDVEFNPGALEVLSTAKRDEISLSREFPNWQAFAIGDEVVRAIGLFDECGFFPAYFEDDDYRRRAEFAGITLRALEISARHDNSSTIKAGYENKNSLTFSRNQVLFQTKVSNEDYSPGSWSLEIRRNNGWE
jgi:GT2 family glycosyltransferase